MKRGLVEASDSARIFQFFEIVDKEFSPRLSERVNLTVYANKLAEEAVNLFMVEGDRDIAHVAFYCNDQRSKVAYISSIGVLPEFYGSGIAKSLLVKVVDKCLSEEMKLLNLEVDVENLKAIKFYEKNGFTFVSDKIMQKKL
jgi:GNAT superfamily N-acetyltransferase